MYVETSSPLPKSCLECRFQFVPIERENNWLSSSAIERDQKIVMRNKSNWKYQVPREIVPLDSILYTRLYVFSFDQAGTGRGKERIERERVVGEAAVCVIIRRESEVRGPVGGNNRNALAGIPIFRLRLREMGQLINYAAQLFPVSRGVRKGERERCKRSSRRIIRFEIIAWTARIIALPTITRAVALQFATCFRQIVDVYR